MEIKEFLMLLIRYGLVSAGAVLVSKGILPQAIADALTDAAAAPIVGVLLYVLVAVLKTMKARFDNAMKQRLLITDPARETYADVKREVIKQNRFIMPV